MVACAHSRETSEPSAGHRVGTLTDCGRATPGIPVPFLSAPSINLLTSTLARPTSRPADSARRVSIDLHKCSQSPAVPEKGQPKIGLYTGLCGHQV